VSHTTNGPPLPEVLQLQQQAVAAPAQ